MSRTLSPDKLQALVRDSHCSVSEVKRLWQRFSKEDREQKGLITLEDFKTMKGFRCNPFASRLGQLFSAEGDGSLSFKSFVDMHSSLHASTLPEERIAWVFALWDFDGRLPHKFKPWKNPLRGQPSVTHSTASPDALQSLQDSSSSCCATGDDVLDASDMRMGIRLLANGPAHEPAKPSQSLSSEITPETLETESESHAARTQKQSLAADMLSPTEISQVLERIAREIEPLGTGISFEEFEGVVSQLPECLANFRLSP